MRGYGSLLMLQVLMEEIEVIEQSTEKHGGRHASSFCPYDAPKPVPNGDSARAANGTPVEAGRRGRTDTKNSAIAPNSRSPSAAVNIQLTPSLSGYLPCHYFDYIGGTSTGG